MLMPPLEHVKPHPPIQSFLFAFVKVPAMLSGCYGVFFFHLLPVLGG